MEATVINRISMEPGAVSALVPVGRDTSRPGDVGRRGAGPRDVGSERRREPDGHATGARSRGRPSGASAINIGSVLFSEQGSGVSFDFLSYIRLLVEGLFGGGEGMRGRVVDVIV